jgi:hypothetical protein
MDANMSLSVEVVEVRGDRATVQGWVWLGPVEVGDRFTAATAGFGEDAIDIRVEAISAPPDAQEVGRTPHVTAVLRGDGLECLRSGLVLLGEVDRPFALAPQPGTQR